MGHQVVYCDKCGRMLREDDFLRGKAHTYENRSYCVECRPLPVAPPTTPMPTSTPRGFKPISTTRIPASAPGGEPLSSGAKPSRAPLYIGLVVAGLIVVVAAIVLSSGGKTNRGEIEVAVSVSAPTTPSRQPDPTNPVTPPATTVPLIEAPAKEAFQKALELKKTDPNNLAALSEAFDQVVKRYPTASVSDLARQEVKEIQQRCSDEIGQVFAQAAVPLSNEDFKGVLEIWGKARTRYGMASWSSAVDEKIREANDLAASRFGPLRARAADAKRINSADEVKKYRERIAHWGIPKYLEEFDKTLAEVIPDKPDTPPPPASKEAADYRLAWKEAMDLAGQRDYDAAAQMLRKGSASLKEEPVKADAAADAKSLALAAAAYSEGKALLAKAAKGQKLTLVYADDSGARATAEGILASTDGHRLEIRVGEQSVVTLAGEIAAATYGDLYRSRAGKKPEDALAAATLCLIEGDVESARKMGSDAALPEKYVALAGEVDAARRNADPKEAEARKLGVQAEAFFFAPSRTLEAIGIYKTLLADFGATGFVRRNKAAFSSRLDGGREFVFAPADLSATSNFKLGKFNTTECLMSTKDVDAAQIKDSYVQIDFSAHADLDYRLWVLAGGCCQEVFAFQVQGTDLQAPNPKKLSELIAVPPGGDAAGAVRLPFSSMKRRHSDHTGPKQPDKWEWIQVPLQKYKEAGAKSVRLLTTQKGFSVAAAVVTALKSAAPKEADVREAEKAKAELPGYAYYRTLFETGGILREWWSGIGGVTIEDLRKCPDFPDKPSGTAIEKSFAAPIDWADNYGQRMRGWVHPPLTGDYVFWIASDDHGELWISSDDRPDAKNLRKIALVPDFTSPNQWTKHAEQQSAPIPLVAGRRYYIEALHKEGGGGDNLSVKWKLPDGTEEGPIPGNRLSPWGGKKK